MKFSPEELEEMRRADEEIEQNFQWTNEEIAASREIDASIKAALKPIEKRRIAEYQRAYYEANKDSIAEYQRAYYEANKDSIAEYQRAYREANKDSIAEKQRAYREANKDSIAEYQRAYYEANKDSIAEYQRAYREANKDSIAEKQQWIKKRRLDHGYSQRALAEAIGASQPMISRLESGQMKLDTFFAKDALCTVLGVNL